LVHEQKSYSTHTDLPELHVHCKLTQVHTPRGSSIQLIYVVIRHLPLLQEEFRIPKLALHSDLRRRAASCRAVPRTCSCSLLYLAAKLVNYH